MKHLKSWSKTVGGARCVGDYPVLFWVIHMLIYTENKSYIGIFGRCGDYDPLYRVPQM